jgi:hypothetical protein
MVHIQFVGGHLDDVPPYAENILAGVGIAMLNWARLEQQLDALLIHVNKKDHSSEPYKPLRTASFKLKIELFERWFARDPRFIRQRKRAIKLVNSRTLASDDRNLLAHSNVQAFFKGPPVRMTVSKIKIAGDDIHFERGGRSDFWTC